MTGEMVRGRAFGLSIDGSAGRFITAGGLACRVVAVAPEEARLRAAHFVAAIFACVELGEEW